MRSELAIPNSAVKEYLHVVDMVARDPHELLTLDPQWKMKRPRKAMSHSVIRITTAFVTKLKVPLFPTTNSLRRKYVMLSLTRP